MADINIGAITEALNNKVDLDGSWGAPSETYDDLTLGASGTTYTAPADGYVVLRMSANSNSIAWCELGYQQLASISNISNVSGHVVETFLPVKKGGVFGTWYGNCTVQRFSFIYAQKTN